MEKVIEITDEYTHVGIFNEMKVGDLFRVPYDDSRYSAIKSESSRRNRDARLKKELKNMMDLRYRVSKKGISGVHLNYKAKMIVLEIYELKNICMDMAELGAAANQKMVEPKADRIKQREVYRWFKSIGQKPCLLEKLVSDGLVHKKRMGKAINSPVCYSKLEIQAALNALKMDEYINK